MSAPRWVSLPLVDKFVLPVINSWNRSADLVFTPTLACRILSLPEEGSTGLTTRLRYDRCRLADQLTWVLLPVAGMDFQPQT